MGTTVGVRALALSVVMLVLAVLSGCGGGEKASASANDVTSTVFRVTVAATVAGVAARDVEEGQTVDLAATVQQVQRTTRAGALIGETVGVPSAPVSVEFRVDAGAGVLTPGTGRVLTGSGGVATAKLVVGAQGGAFSVTAAALVEGTPTASYLLQTTRLLRPALSLAIQDANGAPVSILRGGEIYTVEAFFDRTVVSGQALAKAAIPNANVAFGSDGGEFEPSSAVAITDAAGKARVRFRPARVAGQFRLSGAATEGAASTPVNADVVYEVVVDRTVIGVGEPFVAGTVSVEPSTVGAGGSAAVRVQVRDQTGRIITRPTNVTFATNCVAAGTATITSPVLSVGGIATATYQAQAGCIGTDEIRVAAAVDGLVFEATALGSVTVLAPVASRIEYVSASPANLALAGRGTAQLPESSEVRFRVANDQGVSVPGATVGFELLGSIDARLASTTAVTDAVTGVAVVTVRSGSIPGPVRVLATLQGGASTQSDVLIVSTGAADQAGFSLSASSFSPEGFNFDGEAVQVVVRIVDRFGNPVPDGTQVSFNAEGGSVSPSCVLSGGTCAVTWRSQNPRPANGRATILVRTLGDESFIDGNGNGVFDAGELFQDLPEAWRDDNEDGAYTPGEFFADTDGNSAWSGPNGRYDGALCGQGATCGTSRTVEIRGSVVLVMATSTQRIEATPSSVVINELNGAQIEVRISDLNGNLPPAGTRITAESSLGTLTGETNYTVGTSNSPGPLRLRLQLSSPSPARVGSGTITLKAVTPKGIETTGTVAVQSTSVCDSPTAPLPAICAGGSTVGGLTATPTSVNVLRNQAAVATPIILRVTDSSTQQRPFVGVSVQAVCSSAGASGYTVVPSQSSSSTGNDGTTSISVVVTSGNVISGQATCTFTAGGRSVVVDVRP
jgi:hypothetical protein